MIFLVDFWTQKKRAECLRYLNFFYFAIALPLPLYAANVGWYAGKNDNKLPKTAIYELQVRSVNACSTHMGTAEQRMDCEKKIAPRWDQVTSPEHTQWAEKTCPNTSLQKNIRLGTLDDLMEPTSDVSRAVTLNYLQSLGIDTIWLMPFFPNNSRWNVPHPCDFLGSPYAVIDYFHVDGTLSQKCLQTHTEFGKNPVKSCWGNETLKTFIQEAHKRNIRVMADLAFNHMGHGVISYDTVHHKPVRSWLSNREAFDLWDFEGTFDPSHLDPEILDSEDKLQELVKKNLESAHDLSKLTERCPSLSGHKLVIAFNAWREAFDWERQHFSCDMDWLEYRMPGFYLSKRGPFPAQSVDDTYTSNDGLFQWPDVKLLFLHEDNHLPNREDIRNWELLFRITNYWIAQGIDGMRLDHSSDIRTGLGANMWRYVVGKTKYYAKKRGQQKGQQKAQPEPIFHAEEFHSQRDLAPVVDFMTEGFVTAVTGRTGQVKDSYYAEKLIRQSQNFLPLSRVVGALENHDEKRLTEGTGFSPWTGWGWWLLSSLSQPTVPMILMGQELGEIHKLKFSQADLLESRFHLNPDSLKLLDSYRRALSLRRDHKALQASGVEFLRSPENTTHSGLVAFIKWGTDAQPLLLIHNLWEQPTAFTYQLTSKSLHKSGLKPHLCYQLKNIYTYEPFLGCQSYADLQKPFPVAFTPEERFLWLNFNTCECP